MLWLGILDGTRIAGLWRVWGGDFIWSVSLFSPIWSLVIGLTPRKMGEYRHQPLPPIQEIERTPPFTHLVRNQLRISRYVPGPGFYAIRLTNRINDLSPDADVARHPALKTDYNKDLVKVSRDLTRFLVRKKPTNARRALTRPAQRKSIPKLLPVLGPKAVSAQLCLDPRGRGMFLRGTV